MKSCRMFSIYRRATVRAIRPCWYKVLNNQSYSTTADCYQISRIYNHLPHANKYLRSSRALYSQPSEYSQFQFPWSLSHSNQYLRTCCPSGNRNTNCFLTTNVNTYCNSPSSIYRQFVLPFSQTSIQSYVGSCSGIFQSSGECLRQIQGSTTVKPFPHSFGQPTCQRIYTTCIGMQPTKAHMSQEQQTAHSHIRQEISHKHLPHTFPCSVKCEISEESPQHDSSQNIHHTRCQTSDLLSPHASIKCHITRRRTTGNHSQWPSTTLLRSVTVRSMRTDHHSPWTSLTPIRCTTSVSHVQSISPRCVRSMATDSTTHSTTDSTTHSPIHICVIGSGPAGFYTAQQLLKGSQSIHVDIYERLPVPFGLVRFGVAPDHPEVKNVINTFTQIANHERCTFMGNVCVGRDVTLDQLRAAYTGIVMCYGCDDDRKLHIPGEDMSDVLSAREFVGWYNGVAEHAHLEVDLSVDTVVILGQGNVALDMARMLLTPPDLLCKTDITEHALHKLQSSRVRRVHIVGRRGPLQVAFTIKELREMTKIPLCTSRVDPADFVGLYNSIEDLPRPRRRLTQLMEDIAAKQHTQPHAPQHIQSKEAEMSESRRTTEWGLTFLRSPVEILSEDGRVSGVKCVVNTLQGEKGKEKAVATSDTEIIPCGYVIRSIGYQGVNIDPSLSFDESSHTFLSTDGRIQGSHDTYCSGWMRRGPEGVILTTMNDAFDVGRQIVKDLDSGQLVPRQTHGKEEILHHLHSIQSKGVSVTQVNLN